MRGSILIRNAHSIVTMNKNREVLKNKSLLLEDNRITRIQSEVEPGPVCRVVGGEDMWVFPGLINTHHHLYQTLTRCIPEVQEKELFPWLEYLYPIWGRLTSDCVRTGTLIGLGELLKGGCTTAVDHHYVFPRQESKELIDEQIKAAGELGMRFHPCRGSMSLGRSQGGLPPEHVVQDEDEIMEDSLRLIKKCHDDSDYSMVRLVLAPCSPFSVSQSLLEKTLDLARQYRVHCHTHLAETLDETRYCEERYGMRPLSLMEKTGWLGEDIWFAHGIHFTPAEIETLAATGTGVAHCPTSNQKLSSGIASIPLMREKGVKVGLAVDGSASNDSSSMLTEMKTALLLHKLRWGIGAVTAMDIMDMATRQGALLLGRDDIGSLEEGKAADMFLINRNAIELAGASDDPVTALVTCGSSVDVNMVIVNGKVVVQDGSLVGVHEGDLAREGNELARKLQER